MTSPAAAAADSPKRSPEPLTLRAELPALLKLSTPIVVWSLGLMLMGFVDVLVASMVSPDTLAAVSLGHIFSYSVLAFAYGSLRGLDPFISQAHGARDTAGVSRALGRILLLAALFVVPVGALHLVAAPLLVLLEQPPEVVPITAAYCAALVPGVLPALLFAALSQFSQNVGEMIRPMLVIIVANGVNVALDVALVLGVPALGIPALGAVGCGVATSVVRWAMALLLVALMWRRLRELWPSNWREVAAVRPMLQVLSYGLPVGAQACLEGWAFSALGLMMGWLGSAELAAHAVAINLASLTYMIPYGLGAAASARVGHHVGAGTPRWALAAWLPVGMAAGWMLTSALVLGLGRETLAGFYTDDAEVFGLVVVLLPVAAAFQVFDGVQATAYGALRGVGDTRVPALANMLGYWIIGLPLGYVFGVRLAQSPQHIWLSVALGLMIIAVFLVVRLALLLRRDVSRIQENVAA